MMKALLATLLALLLLSSCATGGHTAQFEHTAQAPRRARHTYHQAQRRHQQRQRHVAHPYLPWH